VHSELDGVEMGNATEQFAEPGCVVGDEVLLGHADDAPFLAVVGTPLDAPAIDVVPDAERKVEPMCVRLFDEAVEGVEMFLLLAFGHADDADFRELRQREEIRVGRREIAGRLVREQQHERTEPTPRELVEIPFPILWAEKPILEVAAMHRVDGHGAFGDVGCFGSVENVAEGVVVRGVADGFCDVEKAIHRAPVAPARNDERPLVGASDEDAFRVRRHFLVRGEELADERGVLSADNDAVSRFRLSLAEGEGTLL